MSSKSTSTEKRDADANYITPPARGALAICDRQGGGSQDVSPVSLVSLTGREYGRQGLVTRSFSAMGGAAELEQLVMKTYGYPEGKFIPTFDLEGVAFTVSAMMTIAQNASAAGKASPTYDVSFPSLLPVGHAGDGPRCKQGRVQRDDPNTPTTLGKNDCLSILENAAVRAVVKSEIGKGGKRDIQSVLNYSDDEINAMIDLARAKEGFRENRTREEIRKKMVIYMGDKARAKAKRGESDLRL